MSDPAVAFAAVVRRTLGLELDAATLEHFRRYASLIAEWNERIALVSRRDSTRLFAYHFPDSLAAAGRLPPTAAVADFGSGAGLPGIPLKLARPDIRLTLIDSIGKKARFLATAVRELGLDALVLNARAEDVTDCRFDAVLIRLVGSIRDTIAVAAPLLKPNGVVIYYKSVTTARETAQAQPRLERLGLRVRSVQDFQFSEPAPFSRRLVVIGR
jgi:16S rRNA (guanine527-N7)-methyltransferase